MECVPCTLFKAYSSSCAVYNGLILTNGIPTFAAAHFVISHFQSSFQNIFRIFELTIRNSPNYTFQLWKLDSGWFGPQMAILSPGFRPSDKSDAPIFSASEFTSAKEYCFWWSSKLAHILSPSLSHAYIRITLELHCIIMSTWLLIFDTDSPVIIL